SSRRTEALLTQSRLAAASFLRCEPGEAIFGANMTTLNFMLSRTVGRTLHAGDEILVTKLDHDGNVSPWLELSHDVGLKVGLVDDVLICSPYKFFGPHLGLGYVRAELASQWRTYKVRPATHPFETGTLAHELLAGFIAAVEHIESIGWDAIHKHERALGQQFLDGLPEHCSLYGLDRMEKRVPTFAFNVEG